MSVTFEVGQWQSHPEFGRVCAAVEGPESLNVANANAAIILSSIGIDPNAEGWVGTLTVAQVRHAADALEENTSLLQSPSRSQEPGRATIIDCGRSLDQLRRWAWWLRYLADQAEDHETYLVRWG